MAKNYRLIVQGGLQEVAIDDNGDGQYRAEVDGKTYEVELESVDDNTLFRLWVNGERIPIAIRREGMSLDVFIGPDRYTAEIERSAGALTQTGPAIEGEVRLTAPMTGQVTEVLVAADDHVQEGDPLLVMVAMKMNNEIRSPAAGRIVDVAIEAGDAVDQGDLMLVIDTEAE
ncbi:MAG: biotin/lipoyl-binding protein [Chloroflexi bacterium]|nr:biotin/lipoyl-binding protein [Chloroflexota bacterium]